MKGVKYRLEYRILFVCRISRTLVLLGIRKAAPKTRGFGVECFSRTFVPVVVVFTGFCSSSEDDGDGDEEDEEDPNSLASFLDRVDELHSRKDTLEVTQQEIFDLLTAKCAEVRPLYCV